MKKSDQESPNLREIFFSFLWVGAFAFGGAMPLLRRMLIDQKKWMTTEQFLELLSLAQALPGANIGNVTVASGMRLAGIKGAITAFIGLIAIPMMTIILIGYFFVHFGESHAADGIVRGLGVAATGLTAAMAYSIVRPYIRSCRVLGVAAATALVIFVLKIPLIFAVGPLLIVSAITYRVWRA